MMSSGLSIISGFFSTLEASIVLDGSKPYGLGFRYGRTLAEEMSGVAHRVCETASTGLLKISTCN